MISPEYEVGRLSLAPFTQVYCYSNWTKLALAFRNILPNDLDSVDKRIEDFFEKPGSVDQRQDIPIFPDAYPLREYTKIFLGGRIEISRFDASNRRPQEVQAEYGFTALLPLMKSWPLPDLTGKHILYVLKENLEPEQTSLRLEKFGKYFITF